MHGLLPDLAGWSNFYVITGTAAATLIGLVFVVNTLIISARLDVSGEGISVFSTPTVLSFGCALLLSLAASVPWGGIAAMRVLLLALAAGGLVYSAGVAVRAARQRSYAPDPGDWLWYVAAPALAYAALLVSALALRPGGGWTFGIAFVTAFFVFLGIRNAWDVVTYLTLAHLDEQQGRAADAREKDA